MGFLGAVLVLFIGGYILGIRTACAVFRDCQHAYENGEPEQLWKPTLLPISAGRVDPGVESMSGPVMAAARQIKATYRGPFGQAASGRLR